MLQAGSLCSPRAESTPLWALLSMGADRARSEVSAEKLRRLARDRCQAADRIAATCRPSLQFAARACSIQVLRLLILVLIRLYLDDVGIGACTTRIVGSRSVI